MILRRAMEPDLPPEVVWRKDKDSLMWEVNRIILKAKAEEFYQLTYDAQGDLKPYVDTQKLMTFWDEYCLQSDETHAESLWSGIALAMWLRNQKDVASEIKSAALRSGRAPRNHMFL
jgi:asparagine synthetase B (glutamine-hydrolysing)